MKNLDFRKMKFIGFIGAIILTIGITFFMINSSLTGNLKVIDSSDAQIPFELNGANYTTPATISRLKPGKYLLTTKSINHINESFEFEIQKEKTTTISISIEARLDEEAMDIEEKKWDFDKLGKEQEKINEAIIKNNPLTKYLPYETELYSFDYTTDPNGNVSYFIAMNDRDNETETMAKNEVNNFISSKGLNPASITYTWTSR